MSSCKGQPQFSPYSIPLIKGLNHWARMLRHQCHQKLENIHQIIILEKKITINKHNMSETGVIQDTLEKKKKRSMMNIAEEWSRGSYIVNYCLVNILQALSALTCCRINIRINYIYICIYDRKLLRVNGTLCKKANILYIIKEYIVRSGTMVNCHFFKTAVYCYAQERQPWGPSAIWWQLHHRMCNKKNDKVICIDLVKVVRQLILV